MADEIAEYLNGNTFDPSQKVPSFKFGQVGDRLAGKITRRQVREMDDLSNKGAKVKTLILEVEASGGTENGQTLGAGDKRALFIKPSQLLSALSSAMRDQGASTINEGDQIAVEFYDTEPTALSPKKLYRVAYRPTAAAVAASAPSVDDLV